MLEVLTILTDIALGALAYRLARQNQRGLEGLRLELAKVKRHVGLDS